MTQTTMTAELASLLAPLWESPDDFTQWGIVGDYCEELALVEHRMTKWYHCVRYLIREKRIIYHYNKWNTASTASITAVWYSDKLFSHGNGPDNEWYQALFAAQLPDLLLKRIVQPEIPDVENTDGRFFTSVESAYLALFEAWDT